MQVIIDERADAAQRDALLKIMTGQETDDMATMWWVYSAMSPNKLEPLFMPIEFEVDVEARRGRFRVPGIVETAGEPIRNPVTGAEHRARIDLPHGFEYRIAEMGSAHHQGDRARSRSGPVEHLRPVRPYPSQQQGRRRLAPVPTMTADWLLAGLRHDRAVVLGSLGFVIISPGSISSLAPASTWR